MADLFRLILEKKNEDVKLRLTETNINLNKGGFNLLWLAINGRSARPRKTNTEFADYDLVHLLLEKGIDSQKKCAQMTHLYSSMFHDRYDISKLLLMYGANPNEYSLLKVHKKRLICDMPLNIAIRKFRPDAVELLISYGAFYNLTTIEKVDTGIKLLHKDKEYTSYHTDRKKMHEILTILKKYYNAEHEETIKEFMLKSNKTGSYENFFPCFEKFPKPRSTLNRDYDFDY